MKKITTSIVFIVIYTISFTSTSFAGDSYATGFGIVSGNIEYDKYGSCQKEFPILVQFNNRSVRTIENISFSVKAHSQDRSTNMITYKVPIYKSESEQIAEAGGITNYQVQKYVYGQDNSLKGYEYRVYGENWSSGWNSDRIIGRFDEIGMCFKLPTLDNNAQPENLVWEIQIDNVRWE